MLWIVLVFIVLPLTGFVLVFVVVAVWLFVFGWLVFPGLLFVCFVCFVGDWRWWLGTVNLVVLVVLFGCSLLPGNCVYSRVDDSSFAALWFGWVWGLVVVLFCCIAVWMLLLTCGGGYWLIVLGSTFLCCAVFVVCVLVGYCCLRAVVWGLFDCCVFCGCLLGLVLGVLVGCWRFYYCGLCVVVVWVVCV